MKLWLLKQTDNNDYDTYDSCVVVAETEEDAKMIHPDGESVYMDGFDEWENEENTAWFSKDYVGAWRVTHNHSGWCESPSFVTATCIGEAESWVKAGTVVCASFNAG